MILLNSAAHITPHLRVNAKELYRAAFFHHLGRLHRAIDRGEPTLFRAAYMMAASELLYAMNIDAVELRLLIFGNRALFSPCHAHSQYHISPQSRRQSQPHAIETRHSRRCFRITSSLPPRRRAVDNRGDVSAEIFFVVGFHRFETYLSPGDDTAKRWRQQCQRRYSTSPRRCHF